MLYELIEETLPASWARYGNIVSDEAKLVISAIERAWVNNGSVSVPYWAEKIGAEKLNNLLYVLGKSDWVETTMLARYGSFKLNTLSLSEFMTQLQMDSYRRHHRLELYKMRCAPYVSQTDLVRTPSGTDTTGLNRVGFATSANQTFGISSGTSGCKKVRFVMNDRAQEFVASNMDSLAKDMSKGQGESLSTLAELLKIKDKSAFYVALQSNYNSIYANSQVEMADVLDSVSTSI